MTPAFLLRSDVHYCEVDGVYIFLQAVEDRYFAMSQHQSRLFDELKVHSPAKPMKQKLSGFALQLLNAGILTNTPANGRPIKACESRPVTASILDNSVEAKPGLSEISRFLAALFSSRLEWLRNKRRMDRISRTIVRWRNVDRAHPALTSEVHSAACMFHSLTPLALTTSDRCLLRSLALVRYLALFGFYASLEIGVRTSPFVAHCWAEHDGVALNDHADNIREYKKIWSI